MYFLLHIKFRHFISIIKCILEILFHYIHLMFMKWEDFPIVYYTKYIHEKWLKIENIIVSHRIIFSIFIFQFQLIFFLLFKSSRCKHFSLLTWLSCWDFIARLFLKFIIVNHEECLKPLLSFMSHFSIKFFIKVFKHF